MEVAGLLPAIFRRLEPGVWKGLFEDERRRRRRSSPTVHDAFVAALPDGRSVLMIHATWPIPDVPSEPVTQVTVWYVRDGSSPLKVVSAFGSKTDLDGKGGDDTLVPLAHLTVDDRTFWLGPAYGYESGSFRVIEVTDARPRRLVDVSLRW